MITFEVVQESYGWAVRRDARMMMPAPSRAVAVAAALGMVRVLREHGELAELSLEADRALSAA